jgi:hypothetical protein
MLHELIQCISWGRLQLECYPNNREFVRGEERNREEDKEVVILERYLSLELVSVSLVGDRSSKFL